MAYIFGDGFDCYAATADAGGYWDSTTTWNLVAGRFTGSQAVQNQNGAFVMLTKSSGVNDAVHHIICAVRQTTALGGTTLGDYFQFVDNVTNQCCIVFRSDGAILLTSATPAGTVLATYTGAIAAANTWVAFEFEVVIHPTAGSFTVRKNGNPANDFTATSLNTRPGANSYANKLQIGNVTASSSLVQQLDDVLWRSDAASLPWLGDIRCYTRMPVSDASAQFSRSPTIATVAFTNVFSSTATANGTAKYMGLTSTIDGTVGSATVTMSTGYTGNMKCSLFASSGSAPTTVLGSATPIVNPVSGVNTFTFGTPVSVTKGTQYWLGFDCDSASGSYTTTAASGGLNSTTAYASFPVASPSTILSSPAVCSMLITVNNNFTVVNEPQQDAATTYVYDSTPGHADLYNIAPIVSTPTTVVAVTTRAYMQKSDAGTRTAAVSLKSGATTVASPTLNLSTGWTWAWRTDTTDPATGAAWTAVGVNNAQIGPVVVA